MANDVSAKKILKRARKIVKSRWTKGSIARDDLGRRISPYHDDAACFCAYGAIDRATFELTGMTFTPEAARAETAFGNTVYKELKTSVPDFNDNIAQSADDVAAMFKRAIDSL